MKMQATSSLISRMVLGFITLAIFSIPLGQRVVNGQLKSVGQRWPADQLVSTSSVNHAPFNQLLQKYVNTEGEVNYGAWKQSAQDRAALQKYLVSLSQVNPRASAAREANLAYWINAYNAVTLEGILEVYPTTSIQNHTKKIGYNLWKDLKLIVGDTQINLEDIEHKVLRKMNEPRIHFAIVCASIGCPRLLNEAYNSTDLEKQLAVNTRDFFSRSRNLRYDSRRNKIELSAIMKWFGSDFGANTSAQLASISSHLPDQIQQVVRRGGYSVGYLDYDWNLNVQR